MQYITEPIYNAYCAVWNYLYNVPQDYDCDPIEAQNKLNVLVMEIQQHIIIKQQKLKKELDDLQENFTKFIHSQEYSEQRRVEFCRLIANRKNDYNMLIAINNQMEKIKQIKTQIITMRKDKEYLKQILPTVENLVFAASYDGTLQIKLIKFTEFLQYLWGKEYTINPEINLVEEEFRKVMTKIPIDEDYEQACMEFSTQSLIHPQIIYRCNEEKSKIITQQSIQSMSTQDSLQQQGIQVDVQYN